MLNWELSIFSKEIEPQNHSLLRQKNHTRKWWRNIMHRAEVNFKSAEIRQSVKRAEFGMREFHERSVQSASFLQKTKWLKRVQNMSKFLVVLTIRNLLSSSRLIYPSRVYLIVQEHPCREMLPLCMLFQISSKTSRQDLISCTNVRVNFRQFSKGTTVLSCTCSRLSWNAR